jgi:hypothetical protein
MAPTAWRWVHAYARECIGSHGRTTCCMLPATRVLRGSVTYATLLAGSVAPLQPSGPLKPTAMDSDPSQSVVSPETANRRMSRDMSGPLIDIPDGTTVSTHVTNTCLPAGERPNKTPIFISGLRVPVPSWTGCGRSALAALTAQLKA